MKEITDLKSIQLKFKKSKINHSKRTLVISLDECVLKTTIFKEEFPRIDCIFKYQKLKIYVCFRNHLKQFLELM